MESKLYVVTDKLVLEEKAKTWCKLPYPDHPHGCPNYGKKDTCPPRAPDVREYFDFNVSLFVVVVKFDLAAHVAKMHERLPHWSERQCRNLLYWQSSVKKRLEEVVNLTFPGLIQTAVSYVPEAMGVDVFSTLAKLNVPIERNPVQYVHKVALVGRPKNESHL